MAIRIFDGNLCLRRRLEMDQTGAPLRALAYDNMYNKSETKIWVFDHPKGNLKRRAIYPDYKMNRTPPAENIIAFIKLWQEMVKLTGVFSIQVPGYEADDIIYSLCKINNGQPIIVESNDGDLRALEVMPNVKLESNALNMIEPEYVQLYKATVGDPSDNIRGVPGFGKKTWNDCDKELLWEWYEGLITTLPDLPPRVLNYMEANQDEVRMIYKLVQFIEVPPLDLLPHLHVQNADPQRVEGMLSKFLH